MTLQQSLTVKTKGRGMIDVTDQIAAIVSHSQITAGICNIFLHHTSASLILCENADPTVQTDLEAFMQRFVPDGDNLFKHTLEGPDDMPAHIRTVITQSFLTIPITEKKLNLGTWQGIYVWEHRFAGHARKITITII